VPPRSKFALLSQPPQPLPDDVPAAADPPARAEETKQPRPRKGSATTTQPASDALATPIAPAATTIRLRRSAAEPLNEAWLNERRLGDPKLSYPEFASMIVQLGLAAYERRRHGRPA
jgi:hypothetical protein